MDLEHDSYMSHKVRKSVFGFPTWSDTSRSVQLQKMARCLKFWMYGGEELCYPCSKNKSTDQLRNDCEANLGLCFGIGKKDRFSHDTAHIVLLNILENGSVPT